MQKITKFNSKKRLPVAGGNDRYSLIIRRMFKFPIFSKGIDCLLKEIKKMLTKDSKLWIATVNPEFVVEASKDPRFRKILNSTWLNVPDGVGIIWAMKVLAGGKGRFIRSITTGIEVLQGQHREMLIPGVELMDGLCQMAENQKKTVYFLGGWEDRAKKTADFFKKKYPGLRVAGHTDENFDFETKCDILFVSLGMKKQEEWIEANLEKLKVGLVMGVGRSFDYYSGALARAPESWRHRGLEWLYSLLKQPSRWKRQLRLPKFIWLVAKSHPRT